MSELVFAKQFLTNLDNKSIKYQPDHVFDPKTFQTRIPYTLPKLSNPPHPLPPKPSTGAQRPPGAERATSTTNTINVTLKSSRNPSMTLSLPSTAPSTTISSLKQQVQTYIGGSPVVSIEKIKILLNKKPVPPSKQTMADVTDGDVKDLEFGIMVIGGAPDPPPQSSAVKDKEPDAAGPGSENAAVEAETGQNPSEIMSSTVPLTTTMEGVEASTTHSEPVQPGEASGSAILQTTEFWDDLQGYLAQRIRDQDEAVRLRGVFERAFQSSSASP